MNAPERNLNDKVWWKIYLKGTVFLLPAVLVLAFSCVFLFPKLQEIWRIAGFDAALALNSLHAALFLAQNALWILVAAVVIAFLLEYRSQHWPRYRAMVVGAVTFLVNTTILVFMTGMFMSLLLVAPALLK